MNVRALRLMLLGAAAAAVQMAAASTTTCPVYVQSEETSTLTDPITKVVSSTDDESGSDSSSAGSSGLSGSSSSDGFTDAGSTNGGSSADVGGSDSSGTSATAGSAGSSSSTTSNTTGSSSGSSGTPSSTTATPSTTTSTPSTTTSSTTGSASTSTSTTTTPTTTTSTPSTTTSTSTTTTATSSASSTDSDTGVSVSARRRLQVVSVDTGSTSVSVSADTTSSSATAGVSTSSSTTGTSTSTTATASGSSATASTSVQTSSSGSVSVSSSSSSDSDVLSCDSTFYSQWDTFGLTCGGSSLDVDSAVSAASCVIYSGSVGTVSGSTCVSICAFPACTDGEWDYGADNGIASSVYDGLEIDSFLTSEVIAALEERASSVSTFLANSTMTDSEQCTYTSESSFDDCTCSAWLIDSSSSGSVADAAKKKQREEDEASGVITTDTTTSAGSVVAATSKSVASVTVAITGVAAIASTAVGGVSSASASIAAAGSTMAITTVEICQFGVLINQLNLHGKSSALSLFGKAMAPSTFTFLPFGQLDDDDDSDSSSSGSSSSSTSTSSSGSSTRRRLASGSSDSGSSDTEDSLSGIAKYARQVGVQEDMLFIVTLAGVACIMAGVVGLFGLGYVLSGLVMPREEYLTKFFDKMIGLEVLVAILSQYTIGVTGTFQIYYSVHYESFWNAKCLFAVAALIFLAAGILVYGYFIIKKHEAEIADVGTVQHLKKTVNMRYGPLYEEYKYKNRFFFAAKMMVALTTGVITGCASMSSTVQISIILAVQVLFFFYLEIQSPHHSKFVQTTTSFVSIMKIAVLVLTFFLISAAASDGFPSSLQNGISLAIVGLNLFVLGLLMIRSLYMLWTKFKLQRDAQYDEEEQTAQDYFKDETPQQRKDGVRASGQAAPTFQSQQSNNPYVEGGVDYNESDEIRLRSATHIRDEQNAAADDPRQQNYDTSRQSAAKHYIANDRNTYGQRRNDVVEL